MHTKFAYMNKKAVSLQAKWRNKPNKTFKIMSKKVVCAITIGDLETKECDTYWLSSDDYEEFTNLLREKLNKKFVKL